MAHYVTFEQAKKLKEKGFNIPLPKIYNTLGELWDAHYTTMQNSSVDSGASCTAPEHWQVIDWLKEKHGIWVRVKPDCYGENWYSEISVCAEKTWRDLEMRHKIISAHHDYNNEQKSSYDAYSAAFDYILENLIK